MNEKLLISASFLFLVGCNDPSQQLSEVEKDVQKSLSKVESIFEEIEKDDRKYAKQRERAEKQKELTRQALNRPQPMWKEQSIELSDSKLQKLLSDGNTIVDGIELGSYTPKGWRITSISAGSTLSSLGLSKGDILVGLDGTSIRSEAPSLPPPDPNNPRAFLDAVSEAGRKDLQLLEDQLRAKSESKQSVVLNVLKKEG